MEWSAEGILLSVSDLGESSSIIEVFTREYGLYKGVVRGGKSVSYTHLRAHET